MSRPVTAANGEPGARISPDLAPALLVVLTRGLTAMVRDNGGARVHPDLVAFMSELQRDVTRREVDAHTPTAAEQVSDSDHRCADADRLDLNRWVTVGEASRRSGISPATLRRWAAAGRITAARAGPRLWLLDSHDAPLEEDR